MVSFAIIAVSDEQIQAWADEAERGYDLTKLAPPLPGRARFLVRGPLRAEEMLTSRSRT